MGNLPRMEMGEEDGEGDDGGGFESLEKSTDEHGRLGVLSWRWGEAEEVEISIEERMKCSERGRE